MALDETDLKQMITEHEGYEEKPYVDSVGKITIGIGHNLTDRGLPPNIIEQLFDMDLDIAYADANKWLGRDRFFNLTKARQYVIIEMSFQLGLDRLSGFKKFKQALAAEDYSEAAHQMLDSKWAQQVPRRASRLAKIMETDNYV